MNREERFAAMEARLGDALRPSPFGAADDRPLVDSIPASSPLIREVRAELERAANTADASPELRLRIRAVLAGQQSLSALLSDDLLPIPRGDAIPEDARDVIDVIERIEDVEEGTPE